jgi:hypothetical protein
MLRARKQQRRISPPPLMHLDTPASVGRTDHALLLSRLDASVGLGRAQRARLGRSANVIRRHSARYRDARDARCEMRQTKSTGCPLRRGDFLYRRNGPDRCYFCKSELYDTLAELAGRRGYRVLLSGANADDAGDWRPGLRAAAEHEVRHPLLDAGADKADVRALARQLGVPSADKPATPCLASRIPYFEPALAARAAAAPRLFSKVFGMGVRRIVTLGYKKATATDSETATSATPTGTTERNSQAPAGPSPDRLRRSGIHQQVEHFSIPDRRWSTFRPAPHRGVHFRPAQRGASSTGLDTPRADDGDMNAPDWPMSRRPPAGRPRCRAHRRQSAPIRSGRARS